MTVRFAEMVQDADDPKSWDCAHCKGKKHKCLLPGNSITVTVPGKKHLGKYPVENVGEVCGAFDWVRSIKEFGEWSDSQIMKHLNICAIPLITPLSSVAMQLFNNAQSTGELKLTGGNYFEQPHFFIDVMNTMTREQSRCRKEKVPKHG